MMRFVILLFIVLLAGCPRTPDPTMDTGARRTEFPGQVSAGGATSGAVMAKAKDMTAAAREAGTPGIPQGAGGNTAGVALGGTTGNSALANSGEQVAGQRRPGSGAPPHETAGASAPAASASQAASSPQSAASAAEAEAAKQKRLLDESMTRVAARWRDRAASEGWPAHPPTAPSSAATPSAAASTANR